MLFDNVLRPYERIIINQRNKIRTLTNQLIKMCQKYITSPYRIPNLLKQISQTEQFDKFTQVLGARFVNEVNTWNRVAFANYLETGYAKNASLIYKGLSADNELKGFLAKQAEEKAKLFKSIPVDLANTIVPKIEKLTVQGATPKTVAYELAKDIPNLLEYQVKTIARTETSKTSVAITGFKSKKNNIPCYQWKASGGRQGDGRTRSSHCKMSDVIIFWEDPPAPEDLFPIIGQNGQKYKNTLGHYHAGCCPNCRCLASPVIFIDDLKFPVRVYTQGMIKTMTKKDFLALYNAKVGELKAENAQKKQLNQKPIEIKKSPEELAKENKAKEEERFLNEQRAKVNRLANEINFYLKQINIIKESLQNQTDRKIIKAETEKINKYSKIIQKYKQELEKINNSIIIADSVVTDSIIKDSNIIKYLIEKAKYLKESIKNILEKNGIIERIPEELKPIKKEIKKLGVKNVFIGEMDIQIAKELKDSLKYIFEIMPELKKKINCVSEAEFFYNKVKDDWEKERYDKYIKFEKEVGSFEVYDEKLNKFVRKSDEEIKEIKNNIKDKSQKKIINLFSIGQDNQKYATVSLYLYKKGFEGIYLFSNRMKKFEENIKENKVDKNYSIAKNSKEFIIHEISHGIDSLLGLSTLENIEKLYEANKGDFSSLSKYGFVGEIREGQTKLSKEEKERQLKEFVAEVICEILTSFNPRPLALEIKKIMEERFFELFKRQLRLSQRS